MLINDTFCTFCRTLDLTSVEQKFLETTTKEGQTFLILRDSQVPLAVFLKVGNRVMEDCNAAKQSICKTRMDYGLLLFWTVAFGNGFYLNCINVVIKINTYT